MCILEENLVYKVTDMAGKQKEPFILTMIILLKEILEEQMKMWKQEYKLNMQSYLTRTSCQAPENVKSSEPERIVRRVKTVGKDVCQMA